MLCSVSNTLRAGINIFFPLLWNLEGYLIDTLSLLPRLITVRVSYVSWVWFRDCSLPHSHYQQLSEQFHYDFCKYQRMGKKVRLIWPSKLEPPPAWTQYRFGHGGDFPAVSWEHVPQSMLPTQPLHSPLVYSVAPASNMHTAPNVLDTWHSQTGGWRRKEATDVTLLHRLGLRIAFEL